MSYKVTKRMEIAGSHHLNLSYPSPCTKLHGHNWVVIVECQSNKLNDNGMVVDFALVKKSVHGLFDHSNINEKLDDIGYKGMNPTAENMARVIMKIVDSLCKEFGGIGKCTKVIVQESEGNTAEYTEPYLCVSNTKPLLQEA